jgi:hypothetical protein
MKTDSIIIIGAAAAALWIIGSTRRTTSTGGRSMFNPFGNTASSLNAGGTVPVTEIQNNTVPGANGYGWRYFSDGTVIDQQGNYYVNGSMIWSPSSGQMGYGI